MDINHHSMNTIKQVLSSKVNSLSFEEHNLSSFLSAEMKYKTIHRLRNEVKV